ncbi:glycerophosphodiester phosphodiesterase [Virgibacillus profundi]|uniref:Glycerophosphodiester phosphodiesterase n=1 Tax=Virgibacillus profundi TaxID=2024555 RepID=A0A2A2IE22_9BACI|nr:glycerophosphodiester phosphodiesterase [Virgibacillus profundi]PAV29566.1 glycerophosphodiester phosphodiesterase [Virgibacillus profundi]PXY53737.1 glycerophosphodiester phosphodiesterase [Virgibacillus profundi]
MKTKIIAHRGASKQAPENTMPAFELAYHQKADGIETDVQLTKDNIPVLIHDEHLKRTTNGTGYIKDYTFEQLNNFDAGSWFTDKFASTKIISLEEFLIWAKDKALYLNIELKNNKIDYKNLESIVYELIEHYQLLNRTTLSTFNPSSVKRLKSFNKEIEVAFLTSKRNKNLVRYAQELGANALHIKYRLFTPLLVNQCHQAEMAIRVYTVNRLANMKKCFNFDCDGIFTDVPEKALQYREMVDQKH